MCRLYLLLLFLFVLTYCVFTFEETRQATAATVVIKSLSFDVMAAKNTTSRIDRANMVVSVQTQYLTLLNMQLQLYVFELML